jgi:PAS domain S-box-containing protein
MNKAPSFEDIFAVMSAASVGDLTARVSMPEHPQLEDTPTRFALALNILLDDLAVSAADVQRELAERGRLAGRRQILADASREFSATTGDVDQLLEVVARRLGELVGDMCVIRPVSEDGEWLEAGGGFYHRDPELLAATREMMSSRQRVGEGISGRAVLSRKPLIERLGIASWMTFPLLCREKVVGIANLLRSSPARPYDEDDFNLVQSIADHAALAIGNAGLYAAEKAARAAAEKAQDDLQASEARYRLMFEQSPLPMWVYELHTRSFLAVNDAAVLHYGYTREEFLRMTIRDIRPAEDVPLLESRIEHLKPLEPPRKWRHRKKDGTLVTVESSSHEFSFDGKRARLVVANDITDRQRAEEMRRAAYELEAQNRRILEASRMKSEFLANMSHELRTPLNAILGFSELLFDGVVPTSSPGYRECLGDIIKSGRHLLRLINDVLDLAKVEAGKVEFHPEAIDLRIVIDEVVSIVRPIAVAKDIALDSSIDPALQGIFIDPARLKQILYNLLSNALKFTPAKGSVAVRAVAGGERTFRLEVEDTGPGIAPEDIGRLFVEFQQLEGGAARQHGGTGLGLALTKRVAEAQGGSVGVRSTVGKGSVFHVVLPRRASLMAAAPGDQPIVTPPGTPPVAPAAPAPRSPEKSGRNIQILVIDDNPSNLKLISRLLSIEGYDVRTAAHANEALQTLEGFHPRMILMDIQMPGMDGLTLTRRLKAAPATRDITIVALTANAMKGDAEKAREAGCDGYVTKPIDTRTLPATLATYLALAREKAT